MVKTLVKQSLLAGVMMGLLAVPAMAQDQTDWLAKERFLLRGRIIDIMPEGDGHVTGTALQTDVSDSVTPEFDVTYFFNEHWAAELIAATAEHEVSAGANDLGEVWILPPTLTLQYHFTPDGNFSPYVGAGINYSWFYGEDSGTGFNGLEVDGGFGYAVQAGFDYWFNDNWGVNFDAKYIDLDVDVDVNLGAALLAANDVELNPLILGGRRILPVLKFHKGKTVSLPNRKIRQAFF